MLSFLLMCGNTTKSVELYGDMGSLNVPDPNMFGGELLMTTSKGGDWESITTSHMNFW